MASAVAAGADAGELRVSVLNPAGKPVPDAVVSLAPVNHTVPASTRAELTIRQHRDRFNPFVLPVSVGSVVRFPNDDPYQHHVFSFSPVKRFEIRLYGKDQIPEVSFDRAGVVALGCNIHDEMRGYVVVLTEPYFAATDVNGATALTGLVPGEYDATIWHPGLKTRDPSLIKKRVSVAAAGDPAPLSFTVQVGAPGRPAAPDRERVSY